MACRGTTVYVQRLLIYATILPIISAITLPYQVTNKPRHSKYTTSTTEPGSGSLATPSSTTSRDKVAVYRYLSTNTGSTCILMKTDAVVEVKFLLHHLEEQADTFMPDNALVDGECLNEDNSHITISWTGYSLVLNFAKTPGGERWFINKVELTASPQLPQFHGILTRGQQRIKLYHKEMLIPTPVGKSYSCEELDIDLLPDESDHPPPGLKGSLLLRLLQLQPFMYKSENFGPAFECKPQQPFQDETAPIAVGSTLAIAVLMTVTGYGIFRYFKVKNVQYNTME